MSIWSYFASKNNRERWGFFGAILASVIAAGWSVFVYTNSLKSNLAAELPNVTASDHSIAGGRDILGAKINTEH